MPDDFAMPPGGLNIRWPDPPLEQEARLQDYKFYAALAYARANRLNRIVIDSPNAAPRHRRQRQGLPRRAPGAATTSASTSSAPPSIGLRLLQGRHALAARAARARATSPRASRRSWSSRRSARSSSTSSRKQLYNWRDDVRPRVSASSTRRANGSLPHGDWLLPAARRAHAGDDRARDRRRGSQRLATPAHARSSRARVDFIDAQGGGARAGRRLAIARVPYFCSGCPHNTSTRCPKAAARWPASAATTWRSGWTATPSTFTPDGRRGRAVDRPGAVHRRRSTSSRTSATAPTSTPASWRSAPRSRPGQHHLQDPLQRRGRDDRRPAGRRPARPCRMIARQLAAEGVSAIVVVTDEPEKYPSDDDLRAGRHRAPPRRARRSAARAARDAGRDRR